MHSMPIHLTLARGIGRVDWPGPFMKIRKTCLSIFGQIYTALQNILYLIGSYASIIKIQ